MRAADRTWLPGFWALMWHRCSCRRSSPAAASSRTDLSSRAPCPLRSLLSSDVCPSRRHTQLRAAALRIKLNKKFVDHHEKNFGSHVSEGTTSSFHYGDNDASGSQLLGARNYHASCHSHAWREDVCTGQPLLHPPTSETPGGSRPACSSTRDAIFDSCASSCSWATRAGVCSARSTSCGYAQNLRVAMLRQVRTFMNATSFGLVLCTLDQHSNGAACAEPAGRGLRFVRVNVSAHVRAASLGLGLSATISASSNHVRYAAPLHKMHSEAPACRRAALYPSFPDICDLLGRSPRRCDFTQKLVSAGHGQWQGERCTHLALCQPWLEGPRGASSSEAGQPGSSLLAASTLNPICSHGASSMPRGCSDRSG